MNCRDQFKEPTEIPFYVITYVWVELSQCSDNQIEALMLDINIHNLLQIFISYSEKGQYQIVVQFFNIFFANKIHFLSIGIKKTMSDTGVFICNHRQVHSDFMIEFGQSKFSTVNVTDPVNIHIWQINFV